MKTTESTAMDQLAEATETVEIPVDLSLTGLNKGVILIDETSGDKYRVTVDAGALKLTLVE